MIVLDEQLGDARIASDISRWYKGTVIPVKQLRPRTRIFDDVVPSLLRSARQPTFITINYKDFWKKIPASPDYCVVCFKISQGQVDELSDLLRRVLSLPGLRTKRERMGAVVSVVDRKVAVYRDWNLPS